MAEIKFILLQILTDSIFACLAFLGFLCGIHYGAELVGLYFWYVEFTLGIIGLSLVVAAITLIKPWITFLFKNGAIYASSSGSLGVIESIAGVFKNFGSTAKVIIFNKLIRDVLANAQESLKGLAVSPFDTIKNALSSRSTNNMSNECSDSETAQVSSDNTVEVEDYLKGIANSPLGTLGKRVLKTALDYVDECILGYCYMNVSEEKGMLVCAAEAFTIFIKNGLKICEKLLAVIAIQSIVKIFCWIIFAAYCIHTFKFSFMNLLICFVIGYLVMFVLNDAILEPIVMYAVINQFNSYEWDESLNETMQGIANSNPAFQKILNKCNLSNQAPDTAPSQGINLDGEESLNDESSNTGTSDTADESESTSTE